MNRKAIITIVIGAVVLILCVGAPLGLHFGQKSHNHLHLDMDKKHSPDQTVVPGEVIAGTMAAIMGHELDGTFGWRPNDFLLWGPTLWADNNANRQLGIIQAIRETNRVFRDSLTKISSDTFDTNLVKADTMFRNDERKLWFPSAENRFKRGVKALKAYIEGLHTSPVSSSLLNQRNVELIKLFEAWTDLLGSAHGNLYRTLNADGSKIRMWQTDNYFYRAQGNAYVMYHVIQALEREYYAHLSHSVKDLFHEVEEALEEAATLKPVIVLNGDAAGITANSRRNLDVFISEARDKMFSIETELVN